MIASPSSYSNMFYRRNDHVPSDIPVHFWIVYRKYSASGTKAMALILSGCRPYAALTTQEVVVSHRLLRTREWSICGSTWMQFPPEWCFPISCPNWSELLVVQPLVSRPIITCIHRLLVLKSVQDPSRMSYKPLRSRHRNTELHDEVSLNLQLQSSHLVL